jgi:hypothetical protein
VAVFFVPARATTHGQCRSSLPFMGKQVPFSVTRPKSPNLSRYGNLRLPTSCLVAAVAHHEPHSVSAHERAYHRQSSPVFPYEIVGAVVRLWTQRGLMQRGSGELQFKPSFNKVIRWFGTPLHHAFRSGGLWKAVWRRIPLLCLSSPELQGPSCTVFSSEGRL